ncbi:MAG: hypothetical protein V8Q89_00790 [Christensenellales bacterium]
MYLYGLMLAGGAVSSPVSISDALKLSDAQVAEAFRYWEKCGIVRIIDGSLLSVEYLNLSASLPDKRPVDNENAHYTKLVQRLQAVLGTRTCPVRNCRKFMIGWKYSGLRMMPLCSSFSIA